MRLLERLQTGWRPRRDEIDMRIRQQPVRPVLRAIVLAAGGRTESREGVIRTDVILWIDEHLEWVLCVDNFWWLS